MGFWRTLYYYAGWNYVSKNDKWNEKQKRLKYLNTEQIKNTKNIKKILKDKKKEKKVFIVENEIKKIYVPPPVPLEITTTRAPTPIPPMTRPTTPTTPIPNYAKLDYEKDDINIEDVILEMKKKYNRPKKKKLKK